MSSPVADRTCLKRDCLLTTPGEPPELRLESDLPWDLLVTPVNKPIERTPSDPPSEKP